MCIIEIDILKINYFLNKKELILLFIKSFLFFLMIVVKVLYIINIFLINY